MVKVPALWKSKLVKSDKSIEIAAIDNIVKVK